MAMIRESFRGCLCLKTVINSSKYFPYTGSLRKLHRRSANPLTFGSKKMLSRLDLAHLQRLQHTEQCRKLSCSSTASSIDTRYDFAADDDGGGGGRRPNGKPGESEWPLTTKWYHMAALTAATLGSLGVFMYMNGRSETKCSESISQSEIDLKYGVRRPDLPTYRSKEVSQHDTTAKRIWVTYRHGVYDITDWVATHPGGKKILLAAGKQLEPFFNTYAVHKSTMAMDIMEELRIGNLHPDDMKIVKVKASDDPYYNDPQRHPALKVNSEKPFNAETPIELLAESYLTPNDLFFIRNHLPVPKVDIKSYKVVLTGEGLRRPISFTLADLKKKFKVHTITATVQCAGNRRSEMARTKAVRGLSWSTNAISNAEWTGVKLSDVLAYAGVSEQSVEHVHLQGLDKDIEGVPYEASIPAATAFDPRKDVLLAWAMNGEDIPIDHGYPLRAIVPGVVGARQVKWISKIILSKEESESHWQQNDYKSFNPSIDWDTVDFSKSVAIQEYPVQSAICEPQHGTVLEDSDEVTVRGYAWSGGGRGIIRVDVSVDGGKTWVNAELIKDEKQLLHREWAWTLWEVTVPVPENHKGKLEIICKALDTSHNVQPETPLGIWNLRGLIHNAWHRVQVSVPK